MVFLLGVPAAAAAPTGPVEASVCEDGVVETAVATVWLVLAAVLLVIVVITVFSGRATGAVLAKVTLVVF